MIIMVESRAHSPQTIPNPEKNPALCGRPDVSRSAVCDPDLLLTKEDKDTIDHAFSLVTKAKIALLIIKKMDSSYTSQFRSFYFFESLDDAAEGFAKTVHKQWGVGSAEAQDGILLFLSIEDRKLYFSTGTGIMSRVTRSVIDHAIELLKPSLRANQNYNAILIGLIEMDVALSDDGYGEIQKKHGPITASTSRTPGSCQSHSSRSRPRPSLAMAGN
jgi:hypothetical protein